MDIDAYRRARLQELVDKEAGGVVAEFARLHPRAPDATRLRQLLNPNYRGGNGFKERAARNLEETLGLPHLYFDRGIESAIAAEHTSARPHKAITEAKTGLIKEIPTTAQNSINGDGPKESIQNVTPIGRRSVPVISYVQAGMMSEVVDPFALGDGFEMIDAPPECSSRTFGLRIEGNSMEPRFHDGDTVVIDPALAPRPGDFVVGKNGKEEATFKKYVLRGVDESGDEVFELAPLNEDYPTLNSKRDGLVIIGVCVGRWETLRTY